MEKADVFSHLSPGAQHSHDTQKKRQHEQEQAETIDAEVEVNAKARHPIPVHLSQPDGRSARSDGAPAANPKGERQKEVEGRSGKRNPAR